MCAAKALKENGQSFPPILYIVRLHTHELHVMDSINSIKHGTQDGAQRHEASLLQSNTK